MAHGPGFFLRLSAYWFATSFKWFLVLLVLLPAKVAELSPRRRRPPGWASSSAWGR
jgi:hypothetical protein